MRNNVSGEVRDNGTVMQVHQVHGDIIVGRRRRSRARVSVAPVLLAVLLICGEQYAFSALGDNAFPAGETIGADENRIIRAVAEKLRFCAYEVVAEPVNCPQRATVPPNAQYLDWELVGRAHDGMRVSWHAGSFSVSGAAAMRLWYITEYGQNIAVTTFRFRAEVRWRGAQTAARDVGPILTGGTGQITKREFELSPRAATDAVRAGFDACVATDMSPMEGACPRSKDTPALGNVRWHLVADPLINPIIEQDAEFGLVRVTASYAAIVGPRDESVRRMSFSQSGNYVATLVRTGDGSARLLDLKHVP